MSLVSEVCPATPLCPSRQRYKPVTHSDKKLQSQQAADLTRKKEEEESQLESSGPESRFHAGLKITKLGL